MKDGVDISALLLDLASHTEGTGPAAEDLRVALNGIIARYQLHPSVVLSLLARFTAGYIHLVSLRVTSTLLRRCITRHMTMWWLRRTSITCLWLASPASI